MSKDLGERAGNTRWFEMSQRIEQLVTGEKKLYPNVDFYSASTYYTLGIPIDLYTPIFAVSRVSGWTAHCLEQYANNRLIRPRTDYIGPAIPAAVPAAGSEVGAHQFPSSNHQLPRHSQVPTLKPSGVSLDFELGVPWKLVAGVGN